MDPLAYFSMLTKAVPGNSIANVEIFDGTIDLGAATANGNGTWS
jgi:hypothetical protein